MEAYCVSCKRNTANENSSVRKTKQNRLMFFSNWAPCDKKKNQLSLKIIKQLFNELHQIETH